MVNLLDAMERVAHLEQVVEQQAARIASLETELARRKGRGSGGARASSSESASQGSRRSGKRRSSGRSPGGQPGHEGHGRSLLSVEQVDDLVPVKPCTCHQCGQKLTGDDPHPRRASSDRDPTGAGLRHRVSISHVALPALRHPDRSRLAGGCAAPEFRLQRAGLGWLAHGRLPGQQTQRRHAAGRRLRRTPVPGYGQPTGTRSIDGPHRTDRQTPGPTFGSRRRSTWTRPVGESAALQGLAVDGGDGRGHRLRHSPTPRS